MSKAPTLISRAREEDLHSQAKSYSKTSWHTENAAAALSVWFRTLTWLNCNCTCQATKPPTTDTYTHPENPLLTLNAEAVNTCVLPAPRWHSTAPLPLDVCCTQRMQTWGELLLAASKELWAHTYNTQELFVKIKDKLVWSGTSGMPKALMSSCRKSKRFRLTRQSQVVKLHCEVNSWDIRNSNCLCWIGNWID